MRYGQFFSPRPADRTGAWCSRKDRGHGTGSFRSGKRQGNDCLVPTSRSPPTKAESELTKAPATTAKETSFTASVVEVED